MIDQGFGIQISAWYVVAVVVLLGVLSVVGPILEDICKAWRYRCALPEWERIKDGS